MRTYSYANNRFKLQKIISQNNGLLDANIADIKFDDENNLWMNCFSGIYFLKPNFDKDISYSKRISLLNNVEDVSIINDIFYDNKKLYAIDLGKYFTLDTKKATEQITPFSTYLSMVKINQHNVASLLQNKK